MQLNFKLNIFLQIVTNTKMSIHGNNQVIERLIKEQFIELILEKERFKSIVKVP